MSTEDPDSGVHDRDPEPFLERWSRRKREARSAGQAGDGALPVQSSPPTPATASPAAPPTEALPDIEQLDQDSDYRAFLAPGVDAELRQRALRKLFRGPKFNVLDGLDIYQDDFRSFEPLGTIVTADMRHQLEEAARRLAAGIDAGGRQADAALAAGPTGTAPAAAEDEPEGAAPQRPEEDDDDDDRSA